MGGMGFYSQKVDTIARKTGRSTPLSLSLSHSLSLSVSLSLSLSLSHSIFALSPFLSDCALSQILFFSRDFSATPQKKNSSHEV